MEPNLLSDCSAKVKLPPVFVFPGGIYYIALAARMRPLGSMIESRMLDNVWRNEDAFRQVARENPQLLPLLMAYVEQTPSCHEAFDKDPVLSLKTTFRESGLSEAAWRYVVRYGSRIFKTPWAMAKHQPAFEVAVRYMAALELAGLPPPPPPSLVKAFLHRYNYHRDENFYIYENFLDAVDPIILRAGFLQADRLRLEGKVENFVEEFLGVCWWSEHHTVRPDDNQIKAGWSWLVNQCRAAEVEQLKCCEIDMRSWRARIPNYWPAYSEIEIFPIESSRQLVREAQLMKNCLLNFHEECSNGEIEIYSVRTVATGKRKGCIGFRFDGEAPTIVDIKGIANAPASGEVNAIARELFGWLQDKTNWIRWTEGI